MKLKLLLTRIFFLFFLFSACEKDDEIIQTTSKTDLLSNGQWKITMYTLTPPMDLDGDGIADSDGLAAMDACQRDNLFKFSRNGTLTIDEGLTKCNPNDPQQEISTWSFRNNETEIIIDGTTGLLQELTPSRMRVQVNFGNGKGDFTFTNL